MQKIAGIVLVGVLASGLVIAFLMYRQLGTSSTTLEGTPELVATANGAECGEIILSVKARSLGQWSFDVPKGKTITGTMKVGGDETYDVGLSIWSPTNKNVLFEPDRAHELDFEVVGTIRGEYRFDIDNSHSSFTDKEVTVSVCLV